MSDKSITNTTERRGGDPREDTRSSERFLRPAVDIIEKEDCLTIIADFPGVGKENLDLGIDKGILTIQGEVKPVSKGTEVYREFDLLSYYRQFQLPEAFDQEKVWAEYVNGVLTLRLCKAEAAKPRKIEVQVV